MDWVCFSLAGGFLVGQEQGVLRWAASAAPAELGTAAGIKQPKAAQTLGSWKLHWGREERLDQRP